MKLMLRFGNVQCVVLTAVHKVSGWPNFPHATLCVWLNEMMAKSFRRHYDINNLTQDYRKEKEESKETMSLEVVTCGKNGKKCLMLMRSFHLYSVT